MPSQEWFDQPVARIHPQHTIALDPWLEDWETLHKARMLLPGTAYGYDSTPGKVVQSAIGPAWDVYEWDYAYLNTTETNQIDPGHEAVGYVAWHSVNGWHAFLTAELPAEELSDGWADPRAWGWADWATCSYLLNESFLNLFGPSPTIADLISEVINTGPAGFAMIPTYRERAATVGMLEGLLLVAAEVGEPVYEHTHGLAEVAIKEAQRNTHALPDPTEPLAVRRSGYLTGYDEHTPARDVTINRFRNLPTDTNGNVAVTDLHWLGIRQDTNTPAHPQHRVNGVLRTSKDMDLRVNVPSISKAEVLTCVDTLRLRNELPGGVAVNYTVTEGAERLVACLLLNVSFPCMLYTDDPDTPLPGTLYNL